MKTGNQSASGRGGSLNDLRNNINNNTNNTLLLQTSSDYNNGTEPMSYHPYQQFGNHHPYNNNHQHKSPHEVLSETSGSVEKLRIKNAHCLLLDFFGM
jgi:hypothetical protein